MRFKIEEIGKALKTVREERGLTQKQLAIAAEVPLHKIQRYEWEGGRSTEVPAFDTVIRVLDALGYDVRILERRAKK